MSDYGYEKVKCPFCLPRQEDKYRIKCAGVEHGVTTQLTFQGNKRWYMKKYCCADYQRCKVYKMLAENNT